MATRTRNEVVGETKDTRNLEDFYQDYMMVLEVFDKMDTPDSLTLDPNNNMNGGLEASQGNGLNMDENINFGLSNLGGGLSNGMNFGNDLQQNMVFNEAAGFNPKVKAEIATAPRMKRRVTGNEMNASAMMQGFPDTDTSTNTPSTSNATGGSTKKSRPANSVDDILSHAALAKQRRRERNKVLARKTRIKKKVELEMLKSRIDHLTAENTRLRRIVSDAGIEYNPVVHDPVQGMSLADITAAAAAGVCVSDAALQESVFALTRSGPYDGSMDIQGGSMNNMMNNSTRTEQNTINSIGKEVTTDEVDSDNNSKEEIRIESEIIDIDTAEEEKIESTMNIQGISEEQEDCIIRCVVVEDSVVQAKIMCKHLLSLQSDERIIKCYRTATAEKALIFLKDMGGTNADIWFIDQNLKETGAEKSMKGSELISLIRGQMEAAGTTIVGITANPLTHFAEMNAAGVDVVWGKDDIEKSSMTQKINRLIVSTVHPLFCSVHIFIIPSFMTNFFILYLMIYSLL